MSKKDISSAIFYAFFTSIGIIAIPVWRNSDSVLLGAISFVPSFLIIFFMIRLPAHLKKKNNI